jgi:hypothetical protein
MPENLPYLVSPGTVATALQKIRAAATPNRFTQDFLANTLGMKGGSPKPIIPFFKRIGFLGTDAARNGPIQGVSEYGAVRGCRGPSDEDRLQAAVRHECSGTRLVRLRTQGSRRAGHWARGEVAGRAVVLQTFKILKQQASFGAAAIDVKKGERRGDPNGTTPPADESGRDDGVGIHLSYTINLNLPPSPDIAVFNAIFKALRDNLLR